jgi:hypothetical protein
MMTKQQAIAATRNAREVWLYGVITPDDGQHIKVAKTAMLAALALLDDDQTVNAVHASDDASILLLG